MRIPRFSIQRFMVVVVVLSIFLWAGPVVVPEAVRRWRLCYARAADNQAEATRHYAIAARFQARSKPFAADHERERGDWYAEKSQRYRHALLIPWKFWSMGDGY
jgi:hypothetical protein